MEGVDVHPALRRRRLHPRRQDRQGREVGHLHAQAAQGRRVRGLRLLHRRQGPGHQHAGDRSATPSGEKTVYVNQEQKPKIDGLFRSVGKFRFEAGTSGSVTITNKDTDGYVIVDAVRFVPAGRPGQRPRDGDGRARGGEAEDRRRAGRAEEAGGRGEGSSKPAAPPPPTLVMAVRDETKIEDARINIRGNPHSLGDEVPRGFLPVSRPGASHASLPADQCGRLELAQLAGRSRATR